MTQDTAAPSKLYEAAVGFLVSEKSQANAWEQVCNYVDEWVSAHDTLPPELLPALLNKEFKVVEKQVKKDLAITGRMPSTWRSAKSTALSALRNSIPLINSDGKVMPKTDLSKLIRAAKTGEIKASDFDKFKHHINCAMAILPTLTGKDADDAALILLGIATAASLGKAGVVRVAASASS